MACKHSQSDLNCSSPLCCVPLRISIFILVVCRFHFRFPTHMSRDASSNCFPLLMASSAPLAVMANSPFSVLCSQLLTASTRQGCNFKCFSGVLRSFSLHRFPRPDWSRSCVHSKRREGTPLEFSVFLRLMKIWFTVKDFQSLKALLFKDCVLRSIFTGSEGIRNASERFPNFSSSSDWILSRRCSFARNQ